MTTVDAAIIKHITNGVMNGSNNTSSNHLELRKVAEFTNIDTTTSPGYTYIYANLDKLLIGDVLRFYKAGATTQETIDLVITESCTEDNIAVIVYHLSSIEDTNDLVFQRFINNDNVMVIRNDKLEKLHVEVAANSPALGIYRLASDDPLTLTLLRGIQATALSLYGAHMNITAMM